MSEERPKQKPRRAQVANACLACRTAKLKCSGGHPTCSRCRDREQKCLYDVSEGLTKRQQLRQDISDQKGELNRAMSLLHYLQKGTDQEATEMLARLRIGQSIESVYQCIQSRRREQENVGEGGGGGGGGDGNSQAGPSSQSPLGDPMDDDLSRQNRRLLSLLTPQVRDRWHGPSSASSIPSAVNDWMDIGDGNMSWGPHDPSLLNTQTLDSSTLPSTSDRCSSIASDNLYAHHHQRQPSGGA